MNSLYRNECSIRLLDSDASQTERKRTVSDGVHPMNNLEHKKAAPRFPQRLLLTTDAFGFVLIVPK